MMQLAGVPAKMFPSSLVLKVCIPVSVNTELTQERPPVKVGQGPAHCSAPLVSATKRHTLSDGQLCTSG